MKNNIKSVLSAMIVAGLFCLGTFNAYAQNYLSENEKNNNYESVMKDIGKYISCEQNEVVAEVNNNIEDSYSYPFYFESDINKESKFDLVFVNTDTSNSIELIEVILGCTGKKDTTPIAICPIESKTVIKGLSIKLSYVFTVRYKYTDNNFVSYSGKLQYSIKNQNQEGKKNNGVLVDVLNIMQPDSDVRSLSSSLYESEPNDEFSTADSSGDDCNNYGRFTTTSDNYDYYKVMFTKSAKANFYLSNIPVGCDYDIRVYDENQNLLYYSLNSGSVDDLILNKSILSNKWYYIRVSRFSGTSSSYYLMRVKSYPYGNRAYENSTTSNVNCAGYALNVNDYITISDINLTYSELNNCSSEYSMLQLVKQRFESYMNSNGVNYTQLASYSSVIDTNQYRVVLRIGYEDLDDDGIYEIGTSDLFDYHWWYQTNTGQWANKHGSLDSNLCSNTSGTTNPYNSHEDWDVDIFSDFYDSTCIHYAIDN